MATESIRRRGNSPAGRREQRTRVTARRGTEGKSLAVLCRKMEAEAEDLGDLERLMERDPNALDLKDDYIETAKNISRIYRAMNQIVFKITPVSTRRGR